MFRWELATAIVGYELDINPFDQPDVEAAKVRAREALRGGHRDRTPATRLALLEGGIDAPRYIAIQAFLPPTDENSKRLEAVRLKLRERHRVAVTTSGSAPASCTRPGSTTRGARTRASSSR